MIKRILHTIFSTTLTFLVLFSTLSLTVEKHYCGNNLIDVSIFTEVHRCGSEISEKQQEQVFKKKKCCKDEITVVEGQDELRMTSFDDLDFNTQLFIVSYIETFSVLYESLPKQIIPHKEYAPPKLVYNIQLLDDVFLI